jgi:hypothetical protein
MFGYEDRRTAAERDRDLRQAEKREANALLALGFMKSVVRPLFIEKGANVGLAGKGGYGEAEILVEVDGVTYKIRASVDNEE